MKFEEALQAMRKGRKVRRESWTPGYHYRLDGAFLLTSDGYDAYIHAHDLLATDWQIVGDPPNTTAFDAYYDLALCNKECCKAVCQEDGKPLELHLVGKVSWWPPVTVGQDDEVTVNLSVKPTVPPQA